MAAVGAGSQVVQGVFTGMYQDVFCVFSFTRKPLLDVGSFDLMCMSRKFPPVERAGKPVRSLLTSLGRAEASLVLRQGHESS